MINCGEGAQCWGNLAIPGSQGSRDNGQAEKQTLIMTIPRVLSWSDFQSSGELFTVLCFVRLVRL